MRAFAILFVLALIVAPTFAADITSASDNVPVNLTIDEYQSINFTSGGIDLLVDSGSFDNPAHIGTASGSAMFDCAANVPFSVHCYTSGDFGGAAPTCSFPAGSGDIQTFSASGSYTGVEVDVDVSVGLDQDPGTWSGSLYVETSGAL